jgi:hypothetical protein
MLTHTKSSRTNILLLTVVFSAKKQKEMAKTLHNLKKFSIFAPKSIGYGKKPFSSIHMGGIHHLQS